MSNTVKVGFSNSGQAAHYVVENNALSSEFGVAHILGAASVTANVTGGAITDPYSVDGGTVNGMYTPIGSYDEAYRFNAIGWNKVKNVTVTAEGDDSILFIADNFVHADMDFSKVNNDVDLRIYDVKRGNYWTGDGDDRILVTTASNEATWSNTHKISTGAGDDIVTIDKGDANMIATTGVNDVSGKYSIVEADLGEGNDIFRSNNNVASRDIVKGGKGNDTIYTGAGDDTLYGGEDSGVVVTLSDTLYRILAEGDVLFGGTGKDKFVYQAGDGFGFIGDGFDHIVDFEDHDVLELLLNPGDTVETHIATVQTAAGDLTGTMVTINNEASVFLENYTNEANIFV